jgi:hypothetical protein
MKAIRRMAPGSMRIMPRFLSRSKKSLMEKGFEGGLDAMEDMLSGLLKKLCLLKSPLTPLFQRGEFFPL